MALNREQKRALQKAGQLGPDGESVAPRERRQPQPRPKGERTGARQFLREVRSELRKVAWPTRSETINYSIIVLVVIVILTALIAGFDWLFGQFILTLFDTGASEQTLSSI
ncbi:MAG: Protein translocase subunit SecE [Acidimicrobiales bacterium]|nr:MAG: preprotein translocase subunit SecE [Actinomycetota bacterium]MBV6510066.1 Protein translocase subunit SecE [Acidimicrobiales bacterium]RIK02834.1 MAG: preprotein translocase subunit SecE [Acidobacteriota bacterium]